MIFSRLKEVEIPSKTLCLCCNARLTAKARGNLSSKPSSPSCETLFQFLATVAIVIKVVGETVTSSQSPS